MASKATKTAPEESTALPPKIDREALRFHRRGQRWDWYTTDSHWTSQQSWIRLLDKVYVAFI